MTTRLLAIAAGAALILAGCSGSTPSPATSTNIAPTPDASTAPQTGPAPTKPGAGPQAGCPVDAATLEKAVKEDPKFADDVVVGKGLEEITCYQDYATALTRPDNIEPAVVVFRYDGAKKMWVALAAGTDVDCKGSQVPQAVIAHLPRCTR